MLKWLQITTEFLKSNLVAITLVIFFLLDTINFNIHRTIGLTFANSASFYFKGVIQLILLVYLFVKLKQRYLFWIILVVLFIPVIWSFTNYNHNITNLNDCFIIIRYSSKYLFSVILFLAITELPNSLKKNMFTVFEWIYILSAALVITAALFQISYFSTYGLNRFGYKPLIAAQNEISFWWVIGIVYFLRKYESQSILSNLFVFIIVSIGGMLLGTKVTLLFVLILSLYLLFFSSIDGRYRVWSFIIIVVFTVLFIYFSGVFDYFYDIYRERGFLISFTSMRSLLFQERVPDVISSWSWFNYLIGGIFSINYLTEMDLIDLFMICGILGTISFLFVLWKSLFNFNVQNRFGWLLVVSFFLIGGFGGHVFQSGVCAIYLAISSYYLQKEAILD